MLRPLKAVCFAAAGLSVASAAPGDPTVNWQTFLARQDLVWTSNPTEWANAPFIGNGNLGATIHQDGSGGLGWDVNQTDLSHGGSRYPMGRMVLLPGGAITGGEARLDLWDAEATGVLHTPRGDVHWRSFVSGSPAVIVVDFSGMRGENQMDLLWLPVLARPPGQMRQGKTLTPDSLNPAPTVTTGPGLVTSTQRFLSGGAYAVVMRRILSVGLHKVFVLGVGKGDTEDTALVSAESSVDAAASQGLAGLVTTHRKWWHQYYPASFVSIPDARLEAFYWIQMYKLGSAMRPDGPILDLMGPWFHSTPWPHLWWNMDTEIGYSPIFESNHVNLGESLFGSLDRHRQQLINNVPLALRSEAAAIGRISDQSLVSPVDLAGAQTDSNREIGDLTWVTFLYWQSYRYQMDDAVLRERVLPILGRAIGYYLQFVVKGADGRYHLPRTFSPELAAVQDANYDLALLRWGLLTLVSSSERLHINDPRILRWRDVLAHLVPLQMGPTGLLIGKGRPLAESHRHYSHLLAIYPLHLVTPDRPADRKLIEDSVHNWDTRTEKLRGYSYTGAASIYAELGDGNRALDHLHVLLDRFVLPNTFYTEAGPIVDAPLSAATSLQEMLFQSWGGKLRVFPAVPTDWKDASFSTLRGEGAFLVSAVRRSGATSWIRIQSLMGGTCRLVVPDWTTAAIRATSAPSQTEIAATIPGEFLITLPKLSWIVIAPSASSPLASLSPTDMPAGSSNPYPQRYR